MLRVALFFDNRARPETTGGYCLRALRELAQVEHFLPEAWEQVPRTGFDLYLNVDDGGPYRLPADLHPSTWWAIDTHLDFQRCLTKAHDFDWVFAAQRDGAVQLRDEGISATWLPLACDPGIHRRHEVAKTWDVAFVGNQFPGPRAELLEWIGRHFPRSYSGRCYFEEMARTYSAARLVFNRSIRNDVNMRVFEALACGSLLLTNDLSNNGQHELFQDGRHLATYTGPEELRDKIAYYLKHEAIRERIGAAGRQEAVAKHTYRHRMEQVLARTEQAGSRKVVAVETGPAKDSAGAALPSPAPQQPASTGSAKSVDPGYFQFARPEVVARVPLTARRVLDIGCGAGRLGEAIKRRQAAHVAGIEAVEAAAAEARGRLDEVLVGDVERLEQTFAPGSWDAIVCADVLEHLRDPGRLLRRATSWLSPQGRLIASIPNVRHYSMVQTLLDGNWTGEAAGLLDHTHLHFFTRRSIEELFATAGFRIEQMDVVPGPGYAEWAQQVDRGQVQVGRLGIAGLAIAEAEEFFVYQYLVTAVPHETVATPPKASQADAATTASPSGPGRRLRIMYLGDFSSSWRHEAEVANVLEALGHEVGRFHEYLMPSAKHVLAELESGRYDCLLFYKGRIGACTPPEIFAPTGEAVAEVLRCTRVPCYTWYMDRALGFDLQPSRAEWMRRVAPLCRIAFVADGALAQTDWARWHVLREPIGRSSVQKLHVPEEKRKPLAFIGQLYGDRGQELAPVQAEFTIDFLSGVYGSDLSAVLPGYRIVLGPRYPTVPGFWGNRLYVVLGHGGFFLAPEVVGMRAEGFVPGVHYAALGDDPVRDIRFWLQRPGQREHIARAGQDLVLNRFTYEELVPELCRVIAETL